MGKDTAKTESDGWIKMAENDLSDAKFNLSHSKLKTAAFLSHQAAEKALKALYILKFNKLLKVHDLVKLGKQVGADEDILSACDSLNPFYIETRYSLDVSYEKDTIKNAFKNSDKVVKWVKNSLKK